MMLEVRNLTKNFSQRFQNFECHERALRYWAVRKFSYTKQINLDG